MRLPLHIFVACGLLVIGISAYAQQSSQQTFPQCQKPPDLPTLTAKAEGGDRPAQFELGEFKTFHRTGADRQQGVAWLRKSAEQGNARAECRLANALGEGTTVPRNSTEATKWFEKAAADGDPDCEESLALDYRDGIGREKDHVQYLRWLKAAAEHGQSDAQVELGQLYEDGDGVPQDYVKAAGWYRKAAEHVLDLSGAQQGRNDLGLLYLDGDGVPEDYVSAYMWFAISQYPHNLTWRGNLDHAARHMTPQQITEAQRKAAEWIKAHPLPEGCEVLTAATQAAKASD